MFEFSKAELSEAIAKGLYTGTGYPFQSPAVQGEIAQLMKKSKKELVAVCESSDLAMGYLDGYKLYIHV